MEHGLARALWVTTPTYIRVFNAFAPPRPEAEGVHDAEVELFHDAADNIERLHNELFTRHAFASGEFWRGPIGRRIKRKTRIDEELASDLTEAAKLLTKRGMEPIAAHRLLLEPSSSLTSKRGGSCLGNFSPASRPSGLRMSSVSRRARRLSSRGCE